MMWLKINFMINHKKVEIMSNLVLARNGRLARRNRSAFEPFPTLSNLLHEILGEEGTTTLSSNFNEGLTMPKVNIMENEDSFIVNMAVPGFKKEDFEVSVENEELSISAEIDSEEKEDKDNFSRREFGYASFRRTFILPETVEGEKIKASYKDGILHVALPKKEEAKPKPARTIKVS